MKKFWLLALWIIFIAWTLAWCWGNKETNNDTSNNTWDIIIEDISSENDAVINYNDNLVDLASECVISEDNIWSTYDNEASTIEDVQAAIKETITKCTNAWENINKLWGWEWDSSLKDWVIAIIEKEIAYYSKFSEILPYLEKEDLTESENETYESLFAELQTLDEELSQANDNLITIQESFAKDHWFELEDEELANYEAEDISNEINNEKVNNEEINNEEIAE